VRSSAASYESAAAGHTYSRDAVVKGNCVHLSDRRSNGSLTTFVVGGFRVARIPAVSLSRLQVRECSAGVTPVDCVGGRLRISTSHRTYASCLAH
jgi:hypothetical protein